MVGTVQGLGMTFYHDLEGQIFDRLMSSPRSQLSEGTIVGLSLKLRKLGPEEPHSSQRSKHPAS